MPACTGPCTPKGLALDLLFLKAQSRFIVHQPMRIPVVDSTANSAQASQALSAVLACMRATIS